VKRIAISKRPPGSVTVMRSLAPFSSTTVRPDSNATTLREDS
jgi:hypothetical protein